MNVLIIAMDTLRADHLGCYGYSRATSPRIDAFAAQSAVFDHAIATAIPTHPAFSTILTGQYSITHGVVAHGGHIPLSAHAPLLPAIMQKNGYTTCAVDNLAAWHPGFLRGLEFYIDPTSRRSLQFNCDNRGINQRAIPWLERHAAEPFYLLIHYWDAHTPYLPPRAYRSLFYSGEPDQPDNHLLDALERHPLGRLWRETWFNLIGRKFTDPEYIVALYDASIRYCDEGIGQLLEALERTGAAEDTLVVFLSDHGELMYRHGVYFDHHGLYEGNIHVPLIMRHPSIAPGRISPLAAHVDIAPTILGLCGLEIPPQMEGANWVEALRSGEPSKGPQREFLTTQECTWQMKWGLRTKDRKFILARETDFYGTPMRELYDLEADPQELHNIADARPEEVRTLEARLEGWITEKMAQNGLAQDPLMAHGITLGQRWKEERHQEPK